MTRKGWHQRLHRRTSTKGNKFSAGRGKEISNLEDKDDPGYDPNDPKPNVWEGTDTYNEWVKRYRERKAMARANRGGTVIPPHDQFNNYGWIPTNINQRDLAEYGYVGEWRPPEDVRMGKIWIDPADLNDRTLTREDYRYGEKPWGMRYFDVDMRGDYMYLWIRFNKDDTSTALRRALAWFVSKGGKLRHIRFRDPKLRNAFIKQLQEAKARLTSEKESSIKIARVYIEGDPKKYEISALPKKDKDGDNPDDDEYFKDVFDDAEDIPVNSSGEASFVDAAQVSRQAYEAELTREFNIRRQTGSGSLLQKLFHLNLDMVDMDADQDNVYLILTLEKKDVIGAGWSVAKWTARASAAALAYLVGTNRLGKYVPKKEWQPGQYRTRGGKGIKMSGFRGEGISASEYTLPPRRGESQ